MTQIGIPDLRHLLYRRSRTGAESIPTGQRSSDRLCAEVKFNLKKTNRRNTAEAAAWQAGMVLAKKACQCRETQLAAPVSVAAP